MKSIKLLSIINFSLFIMDRLVKYYALHGVLPFSKNYKLIFFDLGQNLTLITSSTIIALLFFLLIKTKIKNGLLFTALGTIFLGGISNLFDRITLGFAIDYFSFFSFSEFNLADILISFGCLIAAIKIISERRKTISEIH